MVKSNNKFLFYRILVFSLSSLVLIISCSTSPQSGSLSGTILLDGQEDHSAITVALYELSELDPDIVAINQEYDFIGVIINQHTDFDHRFANLTKYTQTDANGNFKIKDIPTGRYNVVAMKDSFGFRYIYEVTITNGENELNSLKTKDQRPKIKETNLKLESDKNDFNLSSNFSLSSLVFSLNNRSAITLFPVTHISSDIDTTTTWQTDHHYIIVPEYSNYLEISGSLTIKPGAIIRLNEGVKLTISGDLTAVGNEDNFIWFTSNDSLSFLPFTFYLLPLPPKEEFIPYTYNRVELTGSLNKQVAFCKFDHAGTGLLNNVNGFSILDCIFRNSSCGFKSENVDSAFCSNLLCENITGGSEAGVNFISVDSGIIEKSIFYSSYNGLRVKDQVGIKIENNMFVNNTNGVYLVSFIGDFKNNEFSGNEYDISICGPTSPEISYNIINSNTGIFVLTDVDYQNATPIIQRNNIYCENWFIILAIRNRFDIETNGNYFNGLTDIAEIKQKIMDKEDYPPDEQEDVGNVLINSVSPYEISGAGIHQ